jgi:hypothetical protein
VSDQDAGSKRCRCGHGQDQHTEIEHTGCSFRDSAGSLCECANYGTRCPATRNIPLTGLDLEQCQLRSGHWLNHVARGDGWITIWRNDESPSQ